MQAQPRLTHLNISKASFFARFLWRDMATWPYYINEGSYTVNSFCVQVENGLKRTWSIINEITSRKQTSSLVKEVKCNDKTFTDPNQICEVFNDHFASIGPKLAEEIPANVTGHSHLDYLTIQNHEHSFQFQEINTSAVFSLLSKLCKSKATGLDRISAKVLVRYFQ